MTHPDLDHLTGLIDVFKNYKVDLVATNGTLSSKPEFKEFENQIINKNIRSIILKKSQKILIGNDFYFKILAPLEDFEGREVSDFNTSSIVAKMVYGENTFLFTGDAPKSIEEKLVAEGADLDSDVLKVAHHGSKTSSSEIFLKAISPEVAVIQVGLNNRYGHPSKEVLDSLVKYGINILRTDKNGDIKIISDGKALRITN